MTEKEISSSTAEEISRMAAQDIYKRTAISPFAHPSILLIFVLGTSIGDIYPLLSYGSVGLLALVSFARFLITKRCIERKKCNGKHDIVWYIVLLALHHLIYSFAISAGLYFYQASFESGILVIFFTVSAATNTNALSIRYDVYLTSLVCMLLPPMVTIFLFSEIDALVVVLATFAYLLFLAQIGHNVRKNFYSNAIDQIELAESNKHLIALNQKLDDATVEKKGAEEKQQHAEDNLLEFFNNSLDPIIVLKDRQIIFLNKAATLFLNREKESLINSEINDLIQRQDIESISNLNTLSDPDDATLFEIGFVKPDGNIIFGDTRWMPIHFKNEPAIFLSIRDLTLQKRREADVRKSESQFKFMAERNPDPMLVSSNSKLKYANNAALTLLGFSQDELLGMRVDQVIHPEDMKILRNRRARITQDEALTPDEIRVIRKDGQSLIVIIDTYTSGFLDDDRARVVHLRDVTSIKANEVRRREKELQTRQSQKMEAIGTLAGGIAHDFNNMLTAIVGYTELAQMEVDKNSSAYESLNSVLLVSLRASDLVKQILTFGRRDQEDLVAFDMASCIRSSLVLLRQSISTSIEIKAVFNANRPVIFANETQLQQIIINLFSNAADAIKGKTGSIELSLDDVNIEAGSHAKLSEGAYLKLTIKDDGLGMTPEVREKAFDPFYTTKGTGEGTGLGLYLVYSLLKAHNAVVEIKSDVSTGTCFTIYYPKYDGRVIPEEISKEIRVRGKEQIMVVDDDDMILDLLGRTLMSFGYRVSAMSDGVEALAAFNKAPDEYDLVISDVQMPKMTGKALAMEILKIRAEQDIILCSGYSEIVNEKEALEMGVSSFLTKPISRDTLTREVRKILDRRIALSK